MKPDKKYIFDSFQFKLFLVSAGILTLFKLLFDSSDALIYLLVNDLLVLITITFLFLSAVVYFLNRRTVPLSLIMNIGIISAFIFLLIAFSDSFFALFFEKAYDKIANPGLAASVISIIYVFLITWFAVYIFVALRHLFFLRQSKNLSVYFNTMLAFFVLAAVTRHYLESTDLSFINDTFLMISVLLMFINSIRISWIAFLTKKEKVGLLFLSIIIFVLFVLNASGTGNTATTSKLLYSFSPTLNVFVSLTLIYGAVYFGVLFFTTLFHLPTAEAFDRKAEEVSSLQYFSKLITQVLDFKELAQTVTDITVRLGNADSSWIIWKENGDYISLANKNIGYVDSEAINKIVLKNIDINKISETTFLSVNDFEDKLKMNLPLKRLAVSPLKAHAQVKGLLIAGRKSDNKFGEEDKDAIDTFSDYASVAIENSTLLEESIEKERLEKELDVAREIQRRILPPENPRYTGLEISSVFIPAFEVGGDYYDFFEISDTKLGFVIADVSGKGISAAFIMAEVKGIFQSLSKIIQSPAEILIKANETLKCTLDSKTFVSAVYGLIDFEDETLQLSRAGHLPVLLLRDKEPQRIKPAGLALGLTETEYFKNNLEQVTINLKKDDTIVLYTDGITEAKNERLEDFGEEYFANILMSNLNNKADEISKKVISEVTVFSKEHSQYDDITLVILKWKQKINIDGDKHGRIQHISCK